MTAQFSRHALYGWLDDHRVAFRSSVADLVERYGDHACLWPDGAREVLLPSVPPLLSDLAHPVATQVLSPERNQLPPRRLTGHIRHSDTPAANLALLLPQLTAVFGPSKHTTSRVADVHVWADPLDARCKVTATADHRVPAQKNRLDRRVPGRATQASVTIEPDFPLPLTTDERAALDHLQPVLDGADHDSTKALGFGIASGFDRPVPPDKDLSPGLYRGRAGLIWCAVAESGRFAVFTRDDILRVEFEQWRPARGPGGSWVLLIVRRFGLDNRVSLQGGEYGAPGHRALASNVATALDVPLAHYERDDA